MVCFFLLPYFSFDYGISVTLFQMFEHSQALHAHNQQQRQQGHASSAGNPASSLQESSYNPATSLQYGSVSTAGQNSGNAAAAVITQDQLSSALASALGSSPSPSPLASLNPAQLHSR